VALWTLPDTDAEGQAVDDRGNCDCPRAVRVHLGDQPRGLGISRIGEPVDRVMDRSTCEGPALTRSNRPIAPEHHLTSSCRSEGGATAGELPFGTMWPIARSTPVFRQGQPRTKKRKCGIQPANQSLTTDVFRSRPLLCTTDTLQPAWQPEGDQSRAQRLTRDIRMR